MHYYYLHDEKRHHLINTEFLEFTDVNHDPKMMDYLYSQAAFVNVLPDLSKQTDKCCCPNPDCGCSLFTEHLQDCIKIVMIDLSIESELMYHKHECLACKTHWYNVKLPSNQRPYIDKKGRYVLDNPTEDRSNWKVTVIYNRDEVPTASAPLAVPQQNIDENQCDHVPQKCNIVSCIRNTLKKMMVHFGITSPTTPEK